jgi:nucleotide-binding universal stress UspA family protein
MKQIKNIYVAVDFSITGRNAYRYAKKFAETIDANLTLVHVKETLLMVSDVVVSPFANTNDKEMISELELLMTEEDALDKNAIVGNSVKICLLDGDPSQALIDLSRKKDVDLIIIGSSGLQDFISKITGSISLQLSNKANCPVILVPRDTKWHSIERILYASNFDSLTSKMITSVTDFALGIKASIDFVEVKDVNSEIKGQDIDWSTFFKTVDPHLNYETHTIYGTDVIDELTSYSRKKGIHMSVFVTEHRNFWENIMHKSTTESMALTMSMTMLVMHLEDNTK